MSLEPPSPDSVGSAGPPVLTTTRLQLRKIRPDDLEALVQLDSDPLVMRYLTGGVPTPRADYEGPDGLLSRMCRWSDQPFGFFAAEHEQRFIGWFHLRPSVFDPTILELGYRLFRECWGRGLATEGGRALCRLAFEELDQTAVDACTLPENLASAAVLRKCGMRFVGKATHPRVSIPVDRYLVDRAGFVAR